jgi:hypothetical protein
LAFSMALFGCGGECEKGSTRCRADGRAQVESCVLPCGEFGCSTVWQVVDSCGGPTCVEAESRAFCAVSATPDPACAGVTGDVCVGDTLDTCFAGYVAARRDCLLSRDGLSTRCKVGPDGDGECVPSEAPDDARCVEHPGGYCDDGNRIVSCAVGVRIQEAPCLACTTTSSLACEGGMGAPCKVGGDCLPSLVCDAGRCTATCLTDADCRAARAASWPAPRDDATEVGSLTTCHSGVCGP